MSQQEIKNLIQKIDNTQIAYASAMLSSHVNKLRRETSDRIDPETRVKIHSPNNTVIATVVSKAAVNATVRLPDNSEHRVDLAFITVLPD